MGGRPTHPVRSQPTWTAIYREGSIHIVDNEGELECTLSYDTDPMSHHWLRESDNFRRELEHWQSFREYQQKLRHLDRLETELELDDTEAELIKVLTILSDWQEFDYFQYLNLNDALYFEDRFRESFLQITEREATTEYSPANSAAHNDIGPYLDPFDRSQKEIEAAKKQLNWIKDQWPKVVAEAINPTSMKPEHQPT